MALGDAVGSGKLACRTVDIPFADPEIKIASMVDITAPGRRLLGHGMSSGKTGGKRASGKDGSYFHGNLPKNVSAYRFAALTRHIRLIHRARQVTTA